MSFEDLKWTTGGFVSGSTHSPLYPPQFLLISLLLFADRLFEISKSQCLFFKCDICRPMSDLHLLLKAACPWKYKHYIQLSNSLIINLHIPLKCHVIYQWLWFQCWYTSDVSGLFFGSWVRPYITRCRCIPLLLFFRHVVWEFSNLRLAVAFASQPAMTYIESRFRMSGK